jgi:hypothetical protein
VVARRVTGGGLPRALRRRLRPPPRRARGGAGVGPRHRRHRAPRAGAGGDAGALPRGDQRHAAGVALGGMAEGALLRAREPVARRVLRRAGGGDGEPQRHAGGRGMDRRVRRRRRAGADGRLRGRRGGRGGRDPRGGTARWWGRWARCCSAPRSPPT